MPELTILEIIKTAMNSLMSSRVLILLLLEITLLIIYFIFNKLMNKRVVKTTTIIASLVILGFYASNYFNTIITFINNVSTRIVELIYFPTTLEFVTVMCISLLIMITTLTRKNNRFIKLVNTIMPITISYLFFCIIEYINKNNIAFDEFSVFTDVTLMSLYEFAMGLFVAWIIGLVLYKIDMYLINKIKNNISENDGVEEQLITVTIPPVVFDNDEDIEMPRLKSEIAK